MATAAAPMGTRPPGPSIRRRLLLPLVMLFMVGMAALYWGVRGYANQAANTSFDYLLRASALSLSDSLQLVRGQWQMDMPYAALELLSQAPRDRVFYRVSDIHGTRITGYADLPTPPNRPRLDGDMQVYDAPYRGEMVRFVALRRQVAGPEASAGAIVEVGQTRQARDALAEDILWRATVLLILFTAAVLALVWWGVNRSLRPVARIEQELASRDASELQAIATPVPVELEQLVRTLDGFMARLSTNLDTLRLFIAESAHQLRTPLAALRAQVQVALDEDDTAEQRRSLQAVLRNAEKLSRLVNQLLSDASVNHRSSLQRYEAVDLLAILRQALHESVPQADPQPDVSLQAPAASDGVPMLQGDALMLREAFKNLIDNALRHGRRHGEGAAPCVRVSLFRDGTQWCVTISDDGPGIPAAQAQSIFERFVRGPQTRSEGAGLGLAIVQRVVQSHGGSIDLSNRPGGGLDVCVRLPGDLTT